MAQVFRCKVCGKESKASLCNACFLDEVLTQIGYGETDPSRILQKLVKKYGRLKNLRQLEVYQTIFGPKRIRRVVTTEEGQRCRLVPTYDGYVVVAPMGEKKVREIPITGIEEEELYLTAEGSQISVAPTEKRTQLPMETTEGKRVVTYLEGDVPVHQYVSETSLIVPRYRAPKRGKRTKGSAPPSRYRSPLAGDG